MAVHCNIMQCLTQCICHLELLHTNVNLGIPPDGVVFIRTVVAISLFSRDADLVSHPGIGEHFMLIGHSVMTEDSLGDKITQIRN